MKRLFLPLIGLLAFTGCKVGPDYYPPSVNLPLSFIEERREDSIQIDSDDDLIHWWRAFQDPFLDQLLEEVLCANFDYRIALQKVYQARSQYWVQFTGLFPEIDFDFQGSRSRTSQTVTDPSTTNLGNLTPNNRSQIPSISPFRNFFQTGFTAIWEIDLFGKFQRTADAAYDQWEATKEDARGVKILALSQTATTYVTICGLQERIRVTREIINVDEELWEYYLSRFEGGLAAEQDVERIKASLEVNLAALKSLQIQLNQNIYSLAVLLGKMPELVMLDFQLDHPIPLTDGLIPQTLPSDLLRRRPDIRSAERQLASATEQIGVAVADLFPRVSLIGSSTSFASNPLQGANIGYASSSLGDLFSPRRKIWGIGGLLVLPMIDFGRRLATVDGQFFFKNQAFLNYQKTVVTALQETEQALSAYYNEEERMYHFERQVKAYKKVFDMNEDQFQAGLADYSQMLTAKETWLLSLSNLIDSRQALTIDLISIYRAIGGDW